MAKFGAKSLERLATCHPDIQVVMNEAIKHFDFTILYGTRSTEEQFFLFKKGRKYVDGKWIVSNKSEVVTNMDGAIKQSKHNHSPSQAIDIAPYPIDWTDINRFKKLSEVVKQAMVTVGVQLQWGGDWKQFTDYPHWEIKK